VKGRGQGRKGRRPGLGMVRGDRLGRGPRNRQLWVREGGEEREIGSCTKLEWETLTLTRLGVVLIDQGCWAWPITHEYGSNYKGLTLKP
jgi:hypothetical protein